MHVLSGVHWIRRLGSCGTGCSSGCPAAATATAVATIKVPSERDQCDEKVVACNNYVSKSLDTVGAGTAAAEQSGDRYRNCRDGAEGELGLPK